MFAVDGNRENRWQLPLMSQLPLRPRMSADERCLAGLIRKGRYIIDLNPARAGKYNCLRNVAAEKI